MNILVVSSYLLPHIGGVEVLVDQEARALAREKHDVVVVGGAFGEGEAPSYDPAIWVVCVRGWNPLERRFQVPWPIFGPRLVFALWRYVKWCDVVHVHGFLAASSLIALAFARVLGKKAVLTEHIGPAWYASRMKRFIQRVAIASIGALCVRLANRCIAYNDRVVTLLRQLAGRDDKVAFLANPIDKGFLRAPDAAERSESRRLLGWAVDRPKVLFVGRLVGRKGIDLLLRARSHEFDLVFCGPGDPAILNGARDEGVTYMPARPRRELLGLYHAADLLVVPSRSEGFMLVAQEALVCDLPVLIGDDAGLDRYRGCEGLHFCELSAAAVRRGILAVLERRAVAKEQRQAGAAFETLLPDEGEWVAEVLR